MESTLYTAALLIGAITFVVILFVYKLGKADKKKARWQKQVLHQVVVKHNLNLDEKEKINNYLFAIDNTNRKLIHIDYSSPIDRVSVIDLFKVKSARIDVAENSVFEERRGTSVLVDKGVSEILLEINMNELNPSQYRLQFYQYIDGIQDFNVVKERAAHWQALVNQALKQINQIPKQSA